MLLPFEISFCGHFCFALSFPLFISWPLDDSSEYVTAEFFETLPECSLPSNVSKKTIKMIGHPARLKDVTGQSYPIYACTIANYASYSSVQVIFWA